MSAYSPAQWSVRAPLTFGYSSLVSTVSLLLTSGAAWAAADTPAGATVETVVVTAERREENVQHIASAVSVIGGEAVANSEVRNAGDVIRFVPNMTADTTDGHGRPKFYIRGIGLSDASIWNTNPIGTYVDDVYIWNASTVGFPLFDLERVEVLRGPQGTLWGKNTTGGAINFISRKPSFEPDAYTKVAYGNYDERLIEGAVGGTIKEGVLAARLSGLHQESELFTQNSFLPGTDRWRDSGVRFQLLGQFSDSFDGVLNLHYRDFSGPVLTNGNYNNRETSRFNVPSLADRDDDLRQRGATVTLNKEFGNGATLTSISGFETFDRLQLGGDAVPYESTRTRTAFEVDQLSQEVRLASPANERLKWIVGAHYFNGELVADAESAALPGSLNTAGAPKPISYTINAYTLETESYAAFANVGYDITDKFNLSVGLRGTSETKRVDLVNQTGVTGFAFGDLGQWWLPEQIVNRPLRDDAIQNDEETWDALTYEVTPGYQLNDNLRVYFRHAKGFNGGSFNAGATRQNQVGVIEPEYLKSYELGLKSEWLDNRVVFNLSTFYYDYTEIQQKATTLDANNQQVLTFINAKSGISKGVEVELAVVPITHLQVRLNLGYNNTEFTDFQDSPTSNVRGNWFNRVPRVISNLQLAYEVPLDNGGNLVLDTDWAYRSKSFFNATDQVSAALIEPEYTLGNVSAGYESPGGKYQFRAYALNVTDKIYRNTSLITGSYSNGPPRTYGVAATIKY